METVKIKGMSCNHCVAAVLEALGGIEGVTDVSVDLAGGSASFNRDPAVPTNSIRESIEKAGYELG